MGRYDCSPHLRRIHPCRVLYCPTNRMALLTFRPTKNAAETQNVGCENANLRTRAPLSRAEIRLSKFKSLGPRTHRLREGLPRYAIGRIKADWLASRGDASGLASGGPHTCTS
jgi:hypothetical protein